MLNKTNFFETRVGEYQKPGQESTIHTLDVTQFSSDSFDL